MRVKRGRSNGAEEPRDVSGEGGTGSPGGPAESRPHTSDSHAAPRARSGRRVLHDSTSGRPDSLPCAGHPAIRCGSRPAPKRHTDQGWRRCLIPAPCCTVRALKQDTPTAGRLRRPVPSTPAGSPLLTMSLNRVIADWASVSPVPRNSSRPRDSSRPDARIRSVPSISNDQEVDGCTLGDPANTRPARGGRSHPMATSAQ